MIQILPMGAIVPPGTPIEELTNQFHLAIELQRGVMWQLGDMALGAEREYREHEHQCYPVDASPGLIERAKAVAAAYPIKDRNPEATWTIHMQNKNHPDRVALVAAHVEAGHTSDEARVSHVSIAAPARPAIDIPTTRDWLLAVDVGYYMHRMFRMAGVDAAFQFVEWIERLIARLHHSQGLSHAVICLDSKTNHRYEITKGWPKEYKGDRGTKDPELNKQLAMLPELFSRKNRTIETIDGMEADDLMASYAAQFNGKVTLMTSDKDLRQCLSTKVNILHDMTWEEHPETKQFRPVYSWIVGKWNPREEGETKPDSIKCHMTDPMDYQGAQVCGIIPSLWPHFQAIAGDNTDSISGAIGVGGKTAMNLVLAHGTVQNVLAACRLGEAATTARLTDAILDWEPYAKDTLLLTTMRTDLDVNMVCKIS